MADSDQIDSLMGWWREAGVDTIVDDAAHSWLDQRQNAPVRPSGPASSVQAPAEEMPGELAAFRAWMLNTPMIDAQRTGRLDAVGNPAAGLMVLLDMPEPEDMERGALASGDTGRLLDRMLGAIGRDRQSAYIATLCPIPIPGGKIEPDTMPALTAIAKRHIALCAPKHLLLMGEAASAALCATNLAQARGMERIINHDGGTVAGFATFHPGFLLRFPHFKSESWKDLQLLLEGMDS